MTLIHTICPNCIVLHVDKNEVYFTEVRALAPVFEKSTTKPKPNLDAKELSTKQLLTLEH